MEVKEYKTVDVEGWRVSLPFRVLTSKSVLGTDSEELEDLYNEQLAILERLGYDYCDTFYSIRFGRNNGTTEDTLDGAIQILALKDGCDLVEFENGKIGYVGYYYGFNENYFVIEKEPNAELIINDSKAFSDDIWQTKGEFTTEQWQSTLEDMADTLQSIYEYLDTTEEYGGGCAELYTLGDVINMLHSIKVK